MITNISTYISSIDNNYLFCSAPEGSAIYIAKDIESTIKTCFFFSCRATGRGGGLYVSLGRSTIDSCCLYNCSAASGDLIIYTPDKATATNVQCTRATFTAHTTYLSAKNLDAKFFNISRLELTNMNAYGIGVSFWAYSAFAVKYFNVAECVGSNGIVTI